MSDRHRDRPLHHRQGCFGEGANPKTTTAGEMAQGAEHDVDTDLGAHTPFDVLGGAAAGLAWGVPKIVLNGARRRQLTT
ncbi:hypothetical protein [Nocardia sp. NPDC052112]|uniref:hypothetical protein n=1 Tax=Nocardia sp. NPDC052112 TaxID=3155646 RepID=UPI003448DC00